MTGVGRYSVEPATLPRLVEAELADRAEDVDLFVVNEIGRMELLCDEFVTACNGPFHRCCRRPLLSEVWAVLEIPVPEKGEGPVCASPSG
jgi:nucleoside-triphosphatase THEP1